MCASYYVEKVAGGFKFTEGPVWTPWSTLLFSDIPDNRIYEIGKERRVFATVGGCNGLTFDSEGRLIVCGQSARTVSRLEKDGSWTVIADKYRGKRLNSPNDAVVRSDGSIYFTDPDYGVEQKDRELDFEGVYRIRPDGRIELLEKDIVKPNGLAFSPDEKILYVAECQSGRIRAFSVTESGMLIDGRPFAKQNAKGAYADGIKVDIAGNLYVTTVGGVCVYNANGKQIAFISVPENPTNLNWGDADGKTLYITAQTSVYKVRLEPGGLPRASVNR